MPPGIIDHLLVFVLALALPTYTAFVWLPRARPQLASGQERARLRVFREIMVEEWLLLAVVVAAWSGAGRAAAGLGLRGPAGTAFWIGIGVVAVLIGALALQVRAVHASERARQQMREQLVGTVALLIPRTAGECRWFIALGITAGICEEILYRGFLMAYLGSWLPWPAVLGVSSLIFGVAHLYQGVAGVFKTAGIGVVFGAGYLLTGSVWLPLVLHAAVDIGSGLAGYRALRDEAAAGNGPVAAPPARPDI